MDTTYTPVPYECREAVTEQIKSGRSGKVFFFNNSQAVDEVQGRIITMEEGSDGIFVVFDPPARVRIDRIITLFGKPGAAFDEYDAFANQCLACTGGYDL